jgi:hypothetical protein
MGKVLAGGCFEENTLHSTSTDIRAIRLTSSVVEQVGFCPVYIAKGYALIKLMKAQADACDSGRTRRVPFDLTRFFSY